MAAQAAEAKESDAEPVFNTKKPKKKLKRIKLDIVEEGDGKSYPKKQDRIVINYRTRYYGGDHHKEEVDSGANMEVIVGRMDVIEGWEQCFLADRLSLGCVAKIKMPHSLCYGYHVDIADGQDLHFEIELLQINDTKRVIEPYSELDVVIEEKGNDEFPAKGDYVVIHYEGFYHGGDRHKEKFDSSLDRKKPFGFKIGKKQVIAGWDEGVMRCSVNTKAVLKIPARYGYGDKGSPDKTVPKNQDLKFTVHVLEIKRHK